MIRRYPTPLRESREANAQPVAPHPTIAMRADASRLLSLGSNGLKQDLPGVSFGEFQRLHLLRGKASLFIIGIPTLTSP